MKFFFFFYYTKKNEFREAHYTFLYQEHVHIYISKLFTIDTFLTLENLKIIKFHFQALYKHANVKVNKVYT
jgi:hypothetical protein